MLEKIRLEELLGCQVFQYVRLRSCTKQAFKVKILECDLRAALENGKEVGCGVHLWKNSPMPSIKGNSSTDQSKYVTCDTSRGATHLCFKWLVGTAEAYGAANLTCIESLFFSGVNRG